MPFQRYGIYFTPAPGSLASFGARWLGWDIASGEFFEPLGAEEATKTPRKYGFHGTIKAPFRLADGQTPEALSKALETFCARQATIKLNGLKLAQLGSFLALVPDGDADDLRSLASDTVKSFEGFRAPLTEAELAKRRAKGLSAVEDALLLKWGYPHVMDKFRFHMTLSGRLEKPLRDEVTETLEKHLDEIALSPFTIDALSLVGEAKDGFFHLMQRYPLGK